MLLLLSPKKRIALEHLAVKLLISVLPAIHLSYLSGPLGCSKLQSKASFVGILQYYYAQVICQI
jgi:hypothetical protein